VMRKETQTEDTVPLCGKTGFRKGEKRAS